jgi:(p)ppGpp synthase/HD superfamily hydrolase
VLYNITKILSKNNINVSNAIQSEKAEIGKETPLILTLETRDQKSIDKAMNELNQMPIIKKSIKIMILE